MNLTVRQLYFEAIKVGDELPPLVKAPVDRLQITRYLGASGDFNPLHCDEPYARAAGFPGVSAPAMIGMGFLAELVTEWVRGARQRRLQARFVKIIWPGDVLTVRGRVAERRFDEGGRYVAEIEAWAENQRGELVVRGVATVQLYYSADDEQRQRSGLPPLVVTPAEEEARLARFARTTPPRPGMPIRGGIPPRPGAGPVRPPPPPPPPPARPPPGSELPAEAKATHRPAKPQKAKGARAAPKKAAAKKGSRPAPKKKAPNKKTKKPAARKPAKKGGKKGSASRRR
jgi:acyl dehydratase